MSGTESAVAARLRHIAGGALVLVGLTWMGLCIVVAAHGHGYANILQFLLWFVGGLVVVASGVVMAE